MKVADEWRNLLRRRVDVRRALKAKGIRFRGRVDQERGDKENHDGKNDLKHGERPFSVWTGASPLKSLPRLLFPTLLELLGFRKYSFFLLSQFRCEFGAKVVRFEDLTNFDLGFSGHGVGA